MVWTEMGRAGFLGIMWWLVLVKGYLVKERESHTCIHSLIVASINVNFEHMCDCIDYDQHVLRPGHMSRVFPVYGTAGTRTISRGAISGWVEDGDMNHNTDGWDVGPPGLHKHCDGLRVPADLNATPSYIGMLLDTGWRTARCLRYYWDGENGMGRRGTRRESHDRFLPAPIMQTNTNGVTNELVSMWNSMYGTGTLHSVKKIDHDGWIKFPRSVLYYYHTLCSRNENPHGKVRSFS